MGFETVIANDEKGCDRLASSLQPVKYTIVTFCSCFSSERAWRMGCRRDDTGTGVAWHEERSCKINSYLI